MTRYESHGIRPGMALLRLSHNRNGKPWTMLFRYDTAAAHYEADFKREDLPFDRERIEWDGKEYVSTDNGD